MKKKAFLKNKDASKILYNLYKDVFSKSGNRNLRIPMEIPEETRELYKKSSRYVTDEEIWAYENRLIYISDESFLNELDTVREREINKRQFIFMFIKPVYNWFLTAPSDLPGVYEYENFALQNHLFDEICEAEEIKKWRILEDKVLLSEAEKMAENIRNFLAKYHQ